MGASARRAACIRAILAAVPGSLVLTEAQSVVCDNQRFSFHQGGTKRSNSCLNPLGARLSPPPPPPLLRT